MKLWNILLEMKQVGIIYHYCSWKVFEQIIDDNIVLKDIENRGTLSFTRIGAGMYRFGECRFVLDGTKMSNKYKIVPDSLANLPNRAGKFYKDGKPRYKLPHEQQGEERIYGIASIDLKPYLLAIQINNTDNFSNDELRRLKTKISNITSAKFQVDTHGSWQSFKK